MIRSAQWSRYAKYPFLRQHYAGWEVLYLRRINGWELGTNDCLLAIFSTETSVGWIMEDDTTRPLPGSQPLWNFSQFVGKMTIFTCLLSTPSIVNVSHGALTGIHAHGICFVNLTHYAPLFNILPPAFTGVSRESGRNRSYPNFGL